MVLPEVFTTFTFTKLAVWRLIKNNSKKNFTFIINESIKSIMNEIFFHLLFPESGSKDANNYLIKKRR